MVTVNKYLDGKKNRAIAIGRNSQGIALQALQAMMIEAKFMNRGERSLLTSFNEIEADLGQLIAKTASAATDPQAVDILKEIHAVECRHAATFRQASEVLSIIGGLNQAINGHIGDIERKFTRENQPAYPTQKLIAHEFTFYAYNKWISLRAELPKLDRGSSAMKLSHAVPKSRMSE
jgi:hypothetical protein